MKVYDEETRQCVSTLLGEGSVIPGHTNRLFSAKFNPDDPNVVVSGGWDYKVLIWDLRE